jgi:type III secretory pathway component EscT
VLLLAFARSVTVVAVHPLFGGRVVPRSIVVATGLAIAVATADGSHAPPPPPSAVALGLALARETLVGGAIGLAGLFAFGAIEAAGRLVDDARGANFASLYSPLVDTQSSPFGQLDVYAALALFWSTGLGGSLVVALATSFDLLPPGAPIWFSDDRAGALEAFANGAGALARAGLALGGPAAATCLAVDALVGIAARNAPGVSVTPFSLALKLATCALAIGFTAPARARIWVELFEAHLVSIEMTWRNLCSF